MNLTRVQFKEIIREKVTKRGGIEELMRVVLEVIMEGERDLYKEESGESSNGYRRRRVIYGGNILELKVPRTRRSGFYPKLLMVLKEEHREIEELSSLLYRQGNTMSDISEVLGLLYGQRYSTSQINRLCMSTMEGIKEWRERRLPEKAEALVIDACYLPVRRGGRVEKEAFFVVLGLKEDGSREVFGVYNNPTEGSGIWRSFFEDLQRRGLREVKLIMSDALRGIEEVCEAYFRGVEVQLCTVHAEREILNRVRTKDRQKIAEELKAVFATGNEQDSPEKGMKRFEAFCDRWSGDYKFLKVKREDPRTKYYFTYLAYHSAQRPYLHTTNWVERFNREIKGASKRKAQYPTPESALNHITLIAMNATYLERKIGGLVGGLKKTSIE